MSDNSDDRLPITDDDIRAVVRLVGQVAGMGEPLPERRRTLMLGLAKMIDADVWMWIHSSGWGTDTPIGLAVLDGGWVDDSERGRVIQGTYRPDWNERILTNLNRDQHTTWLFDATHPGWGDGSMFREMTATVALEHLMFSTHPLPGGLFSNIGLHRRTGREPFTSRQMAVAHLVLGQVDWLHYVDPPPIVSEAGLRTLSPRERELMLHLLSGDSRKQIALKMGLSEHTVGDYFKGVYRRLNVSSRGELMAKFLPSA